jgi:hypothetical protein
MRASVQSPDLRAISMSCGKFGFAAIGGVHARPSAT